MNKVQVHKMSHSWSSMWTVLKIRNILMKYGAILQQNHITCDMFALHCTYPWLFNLSHMVNQTPHICFA
jgi:hypothetical protein